ncbi:MAG: hypothetical protein JNM68_16875 [Dinghuibacter sp.]|nr:hypothetical protein [Dinghuibacter sp.]
MYYLKCIAGVLAIFTGLVLIAGFKKNKTAPVEQFAGKRIIMEDHIPAKVTCIADGHVIAYSTICRPKTGYWCIETFCPEEVSESGKKPFLAYCVAYGTILSYANGCVTSDNSRCAKTACPAGTSVIIR